MGDNPLAGLGSAFSAFGQAAEASRDVESARTALREPSPPRSPPSTRRSPSPPSFNFSTINNTDSYDHRPSHHSRNNYTRSYNTSGADCRDMSAGEWGIALILIVVFFILIVWVQGTKM